MRQSLPLRIGRLTLSAAAMACLALPAGADPIQLKLDPDHSTVSFRVRHLFTQVPGQFRDFEGTIELDESDLARSKVSATIQVASIDTNQENRDQDLRSKRFFNVEKYPTIQFSSSEITSVAGKKAKIKGTLDMHGVKREVVLDAEFLGKGTDPWGNQRYGFHASTTINRKDWGMEWNEVLEAGGFLVGDEVEILLDAEAVTAS